MPEPDHVVVVMMENHSYDQIMDGGSQTAFLRALAAQGANFANAFAITHPSEPNYFALFSGSTQGIRDDGYHSYNVPTLAGVLIAAHKSFIGYVEPGSPRKHNPWESFADSQGVERSLAQFPTDFAALPTVSFVIPDLDDDMHDGTVEQGDDWVSAHLGAYATWAQTHNSLLIVTFDEDDDGPLNRIPTIFVGNQVARGLYAQRIDHYSVLHTILAMYGLPPLAKSADAPPITGIWQLGDKPAGAAATPLIPVSAP
ncbi:MAG TPA: alkaline phosphatase family protein [Stellaceae bacterium]|nr:alkaline phosphatase family protein [Stellaceae bacterium]